MFTLVCLLRFAHHKVLSPNVTFHRLETYDTLPIPSDGGKNNDVFFRAPENNFFSKPSIIIPMQTSRNIKTQVEMLSCIKSSSVRLILKASQGITASYYRNANGRSSLSLLQKSRQSILIGRRVSDPNSVLE